MFKSLKFTLYPFTLIYWICTYIRNWMYTNNYFKQTEFSIPIISVGNITVGGTGKTPHVQYISQLLQNTYNTAILSRGYKRKTKGYILADEIATFNTIGDEPYLLSQLCKKTAVAVCEKRVQGVENLLKDIPKLQSIILDDAFQHRSIKPGLQILLVDFNRPIWNDYVFPTGFLREGAYAVLRADIVIVTKCPKELTKSEQEFWREKLKINTQQLYFTTIEYGEIYEAESGKKYKPEDLFIDTHILLITGIAQPKPLNTYLKKYSESLTHLSFPDHYGYSKDDYDEMVSHFNPYKTKVVTTEKDAKKIIEITKNQLPIYVVPIETTFLNNEGDAFNQTIIKYISNSK